MPQVFLVAHDTDYAQTVAAGVGYACSSWLYQLGRSRDVVLRDAGDHTRIELPVSLAESDIDVLNHQFAIGHHKPLQKKGTNPENYSRLNPPFDYEDERASRNKYLEILKNLQGDRARLEQEGQARPPHPMLSLYTAISHYKISDAYNNLHQRWLGADLPAFSANLRFILHAYSTLPNPIDEAIAAWEGAMAMGNGKVDSKVTLLQLVNPASGKGGNSTKADKIGTSNLNGFWLIEFLKFAGFFGLGAPILFKSKDRKTYILRPNQIRLEALDQVMADFRKVFFPTTSVKTDINAALLFTKTFIEAERRTIVESQPSSFLALFGAQRPKVTDVAQGFDVTLSMNMGSAFATMNLATINLPDWLQAVENKEAADAVLGLLEEHLRVVRSIQGHKGDEGSEEVTLLHLYRDFLSGHDPLTFFDFAAQFGGYLLAKRHRNLPTAQLTTQGMETLMSQVQGSGKLGPILNNEGFKAIAKAIRHATVIGQSYAAKRELNYPYEVRYGLGQELLRAAAYPRDFIAALSIFLQAYSAENARIEERIAKKAVADLPRNHRPSVRTNHIDAIVALIDAHTSEVICKMLVAYGYARDQKAPTAEHLTSEPAELSANEPAVIDDAGELDDDETAE